MNPTPTATRLILNLYTLHLNVTIDSYSMQEQDPTVIFFKASLIYRRLLEVTRIFEIKCNIFFIDKNLLYMILQSAVSKRLVKMTESRWPNQDDRIEKTVNVTKNFFSGCQL